jgi:hypothetical protein
VKIKTMILLAALLCGLLMVGGGVWAMSSGNYAINWDVIGGGGGPASSASYAMRGTIGQAAAESSFSTSYGLRSGYWYPAVGGINNLEGQVLLQGRSIPPHASWIADLSVTFLQDSMVMRTENVTTDNEGKFTVADVAAGAYDIGVKGCHTLSRLEEDVVIGSGTTNVNFGTLLEGDCDNNDMVNISDFGILADAFGSLPASGNWDDRADLDNSGAVNISDFGLLADNFGLLGEIV